MKGYNKFLLLLAALLAAGGLVFVLLTASYHTAELHALRLNDLVHTVQEQWDALDTFDGTPYAAEMQIYDSEDFLLYSMEGNLLRDIDSPVKAMQEGCLCLPVHEAARFVGTIVIPNPNQMLFDAARRKLILAAVLLLLGMLLTAVLYGLYVRYAIIRPFRRMERFAADVAAGNLDAPLLVEQHNLFGAFTQSFDIMRTQLKASRQRETELRLKEKEIIASLSHDLKTPITGIKLLCELLSVKVTDPYVLSKLEQIQKKAEQITVLVSDLLTSALDELGEMQVNCQDENASVLHGLVMEHDTRSLVRETPIPACMIAVDKWRLSQIIGNILSNSYKYAGTEMDISYRLREGYLEMTVRDYGKGVPEAEIGLVTTKFYRGNNAAGKDGSGLGLYIASLLMEKMNGELICACRSPGFCVTLLLPLS